MQSTYDLNVRTYVHTHRYVQQQSMDWHDTFDTISYSSTEDHPLHPTTLCTGQDMHTYMLRVPMIHDRATLSQQMCRSVCMDDEWSSHKLPALPHCDCRAHRAAVPVRVISPSGYVCMCTCVYCILMYVRTIHSNISHNIVGTYCMYACK